jgi:DNA polymerase elongation subunit (family B)
VIDKLMGRIKPISKKLVYKKHLYGYNLVNNQIATYPYLLCVFSSKFDIKSFEYRMKSPLEIYGVGKYLFKVHETHADPILQMVCCRKISTAGWISFKGVLVRPENKLTNCPEEYIVAWKNLFPEKDIDIICYPKILSFDIEVNSSNPAIMPDAKKPEDKIFQISCVIVDNDITTSHLLSLGNPDQQKTGTDVTIHTYDTESDLLEGFSSCIRDWNPHVITGYNILGFDFPYMIKRAKLNMCLSSFDLLSMSDNLHSPEKKIKWSSTAFGHQEYEFLDAEGRVILDLLPIIRKDYKLSSYSLKSVSSNFLEETKDDLSPKGIFKCYRLGMKGGVKGSEALGICGKYCVKDSYLVIKLMDKLNIWPALCEFANTCNVSIFSHYTQGQEKKVYSQIYLYAMHNNIVVEKDKYVCKDSERYVGAHIFDPVPGVYDNVIPFDFCSLYPSIMIAYNIDYSTFVEDPSIPDDLCHVMNFEDHVNCKHDPKIIKKLELTTLINEGNELIKSLRSKKKTSKSYIRENNILDGQIKKIKIELGPYVKERASILITNKNVMCEKRNYRFIKEPKGVLPTIIQNLLDARANTRSKIYTNNKLISESTDPSSKKDLEQLNILLDKRQLAYKVGCNSMYGIMAIRNGGSIPFMPGAMCTTYMGRINIQKTADVLKSK